MPNEVEAILAFVQEKVKKGTPPRYGHIRIHFPWSQSKWANVWKKAKEHLVKKHLPEGGYPRYYVKERYIKEVEKVILIQKLIKAAKEGKIQTVEIPEERYAQAIEKYIEKMQPLFNDIAWEEAKRAFLKPSKPVEGQDKKSRVLQLVKKIVSSRDESPLGPITEDHPLVRIANFIKFTEHAAKVEELNTKITLLTLAQCTEIRIIHSKDEPPPSLADDDLSKLLLMLSKYVCARPEVRREKPFHILISFPVLQR